MTVPRDRLLWWTALIVLPCALIGAANPAATGAALAVVAGFAVLVIADALSAGRGLKGVHSELPAVVRMSKDRDGRFELRLHNETRRAKTLRVGLAFPPEIEALEEELTVALPSDTEWSRLTWTCTPRRRGRYPLEAVHLEGTSPLGFWAGRKRVTTKSELRIYPNLMTERRNLAALFLNRGSFGVHAQRQVGKGRDFEKLREYIPGDGYDEVHWKATAKRGRPITKVFQIERTQEVYVVIDASRLSARAPGLELEAVAGRGGTAAERNTTLERYVTAALVLGLAAEKNGDHFGLLTFTDRIETFVRAKNGKTHYNTCREALYLLQPRIVSPDFNEVFTFIRLRLRRRALLVFLTALDDPLLADSFVHNVDLIRNQHLLLVNMVQPPDAAPVFSRPDLSTLDDLYRHLGGHLQWQRLIELGKTLQRRGVQFSTLKNERLSAELVSQYLSVKQRQLL